MEQPKRMEQRKRVNVKQTAKGEWQIDATVEMTAAGVLDNKLIARESIDLVKAVEAEYHADGRRMVGDA